MSVPTKTTPGYTSFIGRQEDGTPQEFVCCVCEAAWLPVLRQYLIFKKLLPASENLLWIMQLTGSEAESANTHSQGGAADLGYTSKEIALAMREMGAPATWVRYKPTFTDEHTHSVLTGCVHNLPARYQITEQMRGGDGLAGTLPDSLPDPQVYRNWEQGILFARGQMNPNSFMIKTLKVGSKDSEVAKFQKFMWSKQPLPYKTSFNSKYYNFDKSGFTSYYGNATGRLVADTYKRLHSLYPTEGWNYGVVNNIWPDEPGPVFIKKLSGSVYI